MDYQKQATDFLESCNATMEIGYVATDTNPRWGENFKRNKYIFTITTPKGSMTDVFWDSVYNLERGIQPTEYDILACLEKYDVGSLDDFWHEFGYEVNCKRDFENLMSTYKAVVRQYNNLCRIFTEAQMEMLREIQ
jgi:hypothetical protein